MRSPDADTRQTGPLELSWAESLTLTLAQNFMLARDVYAERHERRREAKSITQLRFLHDTVRELLLVTTGCRTPPPGRAAHTPSRAADARWVGDLAARVRAMQRPYRHTFVKFRAYDDALARVTSRTRALVLLIELASFDPWDGPKWVAGGRIDSLCTLAAATPPLRPGDVDTVLRQQRAALTRLRRASRRWTRLLPVGALPVVTEAVKLEVLTRVVSLDADDDDARARLLITAHEQQLRRIEAQIAALAVQLNHERHVNTTLRDEIGRLTEQLDELRYVKAVIDDSLGGLVLSSAMSR